jgi:hypothetical protein
LKLYKTSLNSIYNKMIWKAMDVSTETLQKKKSLFELHMQENNF